MASVYRTLSKLLINPKPSFTNPHISKFTFPFALKSHIYPSNVTSFRHYCAVEGGALQETPEKNQTNRLFVFNIPLSYNYDDLKKAFSDFGTVKESRIIKSKNGNGNGKRKRKPGRYGFITMSTGEEAQTVVDKFNSKELGGRTIKVEFPRKTRKTQPQSSTDLPVTKTRHSLFVSRLQWNVRSSHLRDFFSADFNPVSAGVVFKGRKSVGYGFVSFNTKEEAEAALSSLNGKEILGRPVVLKFRKRPTNVEGEAAHADRQDVGKENQDDSVGPVGEEEVSETEQKS